MRSNAYLSALSQRNGGALRRQGGGRGYGIVLATDDRKLFPNRIGQPRVAVCPNCGEVSLYLEDVEKLKE